MFNIRYIILLIIIICIPDISAISISGPPSSTITYKLNSTIYMHYLIEDSNNPINISIYGNLSEHISINWTGNKTFDLISKFPERQEIDAGTYYFILDISEISNKSQGIGSMLSIRKKFKIIVPEKVRTLPVDLDWNADKYLIMIIILAITVICCFMLISRKARTI